MKIEVKQKHIDLYYYKQGYDFGLKMYDELKKINEVE